MKLALLAAVWTLTSCFPLGFLHMYSYKSLGVNLGWFVMEGSGDFMTYDLSYNIGIFECSSVCPFYNVI